MFHRVVKQECKMQPKHVIVEKSVLGTVWFIVAVGLLSDLWCDQLKNWGE